MGSSERWQIEAYSRGTASNGCQRKNLVDGKWYKADTLGAESFAEVLSFHVNQMFGFPSLKYEPGIWRLGRRELPAVVSQDYSEGGNVFSVESLIKKMSGHLWDSVLYEKDPAVKFDKLVDCLVPYVGAGIRKYLLDLFMTDFLNGNPDRHLSNIDVIYRNGEYKMAPFFDYGLSWYAQDDVDPITRDNVAEAVASISFRPFNLRGKTFYQFLVSQGAVLEIPSDWEVKLEKLKQVIDSLHGLYDADFLDSRVLLLESRMEYIRKLQYSNSCLEKHLR